MQAALPYIHIAFPALITVCIFIGTFGSQYIYSLSYGGEDFSDRYYLYKIITANGEVMYFAKDGEKLFGCLPPVHIANAALAMGVIGCASMLAAAGAAVILFKSPTNAPVVLASRVAQVLAAISIAICLALDIGLYKGTFCGGSYTLSEMGLKIDYGFACIIISVILVTIWRIFGFVTAPKSGLGVNENDALLNE